MPSQSLVEQFPFKANDKIWRQLRNLVATLQARFDEVEVLSQTFEGEVSKFEELGLSTLNETITPIVNEALTQLSSVANLFSAASTTQATVGTGVFQFIVNVDEAATFVPLLWVSIYSDSANPAAGMVARVLGWDATTGQLDVDATLSEGSGTYTDWTIISSAPPPASGVTTGQLDAAVAAAVAALVDSAPSGLDTLNELAAAINDDASFHATVTAAIAAKQTASAVLSAIATTSPAANLVPYFTSTSNASQFQISAYMRSIMNSADASVLGAAISAASLNAEDQVLSGGARVTNKDLGTKTTGTVTPDPGDRPCQSYTNGGAHTLAPSTNLGSFLLDITNNATAGAIGTTGWTKVVGSFTTTNGHKFRCSCSIGAAGSLLIIQALQ